MRASNPKRARTSPERQTLQSPQGDFVCLLRRIYSLCPGVCRRGRNGNGARFAGALTPGPSPANCAGEG
jgi:hypothetical protein